MTDLSPEARALLKGVRADFDASPEDCDRVGRALAERLGISSGTIVGATGLAAASAASADSAGAAISGASTTLATSASVGPSGVTLVAGVKWVGVALLVATVGGFLYRMTRDAPAGSGKPVVTVPVVQDRVSDPGPAASAPPFADLALRDDRHDELPTPETREPAVPAHTQASPPPPRDREPSGIPAALAHKVDGTLGAETRLLRRADGELRNGNATRALELLDEHARTFPHGVLSEERSAERITTLCMLGRVGEAREEARRFLTAAADSPLAKVVRASCGVVEDPNRGRVP